MCCVKTYYCFTSEFFFIGKDDKGKVFPWNSDNKLGELGGASKGFLTCDFNKAIINI